MAQAILPLVASGKGSGQLTTISGQSGHLSGIPRKSGQFPPDWVVTFDRNGWSVTSGFGGQFPPENAFP